MARVLAQHCELVARDSARIDLRIAQSHQHLLDKRYQDRLKAALDAHFGASLRLNISVAENVGNSPAAVADREQQHRQEQAVTALEQDPFVRELVENFDGRVVGSTIKPVEK
jgi:DNA polymerase-3 subunit gamma/tau